MNKGRSNILQAHVGSRYLYTVAKTFVIMKQGNGKRKEMPTTDDIVKYTHKGSENKQT